MPTIVGRIPLNPERNLADKEDMEIRCSDCDKVFDVPAEYEGQMGACSGCGHSFVITSDNESPLADAMPDVSAMLADAPEVPPAARVSAQQSAVAVAEESPETEAGASWSDAEAKDASADEASRFVSVSRNVRPYVSPEPAPEPEQPPEARPEASEPAKVKKRKKRKSTGKKELPGRHFASVLYWVGWCGIGLSAVSLLRFFLAPHALDKIGRGVLDIMAVTGSMGFLSAAAAALTTSIIIKSIHAGMWELRKLRRLFLNTDKAQSVVQKIKQLVSEMEQG
jgi:hypothetical protein